MKDFPLDYSQRELANEYAEEHGVDDDVAFEVIGLRAELAAKERECERLKQTVIDAYEEGWREGLGEGLSGRHRPGETEAEINRDWLHSDARRALERGDG